MIDGRIKMPVERMTNSNSELPASVIRELGRI
jgi:hypothetical protein